MENKNTAKFCKNCGYRFPDKPILAPSTERIQKPEKKGLFGRFKSSEPEEPVPVLNRPAPSEEDLSKKVSFLISKINEIEGRMESPETATQRPVRSMDDIGKFHDIMRLLKATEMRIDELERADRHSATNENLEKLRRRMEIGIKEIIHLRESMFKQESRLNELWKMRKVINDQQRRFREIGDVLEDIIRMKSRGKQYATAREPPVSMNSNEDDDVLFENLITKLDEGKRKLKNIVDDMSSSSPVIIE